MKEHYGIIPAVLNPDSRVGYKYDNVGNRLEMTKVEGDSITTTKYEYNEVNELTRFNVNDEPYTEFRYDKNGNRIAKIEPDERITTYTWDYENRLTEAQFHQGKWVGFEYDGDGNRITKLSAMTQPEQDWHDNGIGNDPDFVPPGQSKVKKQQADLLDMLLATGGNGGGSSGGKGGSNSSGNSGSSNGKGNDKDKANTGKGSDKEKSNNGNSKQCVFRLKGGKGD